ncbi:MAG: L,D-transpeptidase [Deltaproteobacteria bacterium]|nr:L,D-transpeptidase [Deltaproteobacteria bacterium]
MRLRTGLLVATAAVAAVTLDLPSLQQAVEGMGRMAASEVGLVQVSPVRAATAYPALTGVPGWTETQLAGTAAAVATAPAGDAPRSPPSAPTVGDGEWGELPVEALGEEDGAEPRDDADDGRLDEEPEGAGLDGPPVLVSVAKETWIFAEPRWRSRRLGYLRAGSVISREPEPATKRGCKRGWYAIEPRGFVCAGSRASLDPSHPVAQLAAKRPSLSGLPYLYATSRYPTPPLYARLPTVEQQQRIEPSRHHLLKKHARLTREKDYVPPPDPDPIPELLQDGQVLPGLAGVRRGAERVSLGRARVRSGFALVGTYDFAERRFGLTTEMALLPLDRTRIVQPSSLRGVRLSDEFTLPIAVVRSRYAKRFVQDASSGALAIGGKLTWRSVLALTGTTRHRRGATYLEVVDGSFIDASKVARIDRFRQAPRWARQGKKWVDVSILRQTLVAYEGTRPVYATLVSTGADGTADHEDSHATIQGTFLIHTKHVSVTMDGDERGDEFDLRDVPFVQYFTEGYALHGAYWHDDFGTPRSHGCVNLAPVDAAWLFGWTDPQVPEGWHGALSLKHGTLVYVHP